MIGIADLFKMLDAGLSRQPVGEAATAIGRRYLLSAKARSQPKRCLAAMVYGYRQTQQEVRHLLPVSPSNEAAAVSLHPTDVDTLHLCFQASSHHTPSNKNLLHTYQSPSKDLYIQPPWPTLSIHLLKPEKAKCRSCFRIVVIVLLVIIT